MLYLEFFQFENLQSQIISGVSYLSREQEDKALKRVNSTYEDESLDSRHSLKEIRDTHLSNIPDILFAERMKNRLSEWLGGLLRNRDGGSEVQPSFNDSKQQFETIFFKMRRAISLKGFTSHQLRLIHLVMLFYL